MILDNKVLISLLKAINCISKDKTRYYLNGVFFVLTEEKQLEIVASDGHILYYNKLDYNYSLSEQEESFLKNGLIINFDKREIKKLLNTKEEFKCDIFMDKKIFFIERKYCEIIDFDYVDYKSVIPETNKENLSDKFIYIDPKFLTIAEKLIDGHSTYVFKDRIMFKKYNERIIIVSTKVAYNEVK